MSIQLGKSLVASDIREGVDVYFDCLVSANPAPKSKLVTWLHNVSIIITIFLTLCVMKNDLQMLYIMILVARYVWYFLLRVCLTRTIAHYKLFISFGIQNEYFKFTQKFAVQSFLLAKFISSFHSNELPIFCT